MYTLELSCTVSAGPIHLVFNTLTLEDISMDNVLYILLGARSQNRPRP
jgi:hypothetical protein